LKIKLNSIKLLEVQTKIGWYVLEEMAHIILEFYDKLSLWEHEIVHESDLSLPQMHALEVIGFYGNAKAKEISGKLGVTTGTFTVMMNTLEKKDLIIKKTNPEDNRSIIISLTEKGNEIYKEHHKYHHELILDICSKCNDEELSNLRNILTKITKSFWRNII